MPSATDEILRLLRAQDARLQKMESDLAELRATVEASKSRCDKLDGLRAKLARIQKEEEQRLRSVACREG